MEPSESQFLNDPHAAAGEEAWRAEVTSRVNSYRARRKGRQGDELSHRFDFGPAVPAQNFAEPAPPPARKPVPSSRNAFDTNYYRRLNAESLAQAPVMAATAPAPDLALDFDTDSQAVATVAAEETVTDAALDLEIRPQSGEESFFEQIRLDQIRVDDVAPGIEPDPEPEPAKPVTQGNLIIFRRPMLEPPLAPQPSRDELAEPISNRPRILEVPEDIMPPVQGSLFPEIRLDADEQESSRAIEPEFHGPPVALISERFMASLADIGIVATASVIFAAMVLRALPDVPHNKPFWMLLGATTLLFWAVYQHIFLLYAGQTPGMKLRQIRLSTFDGRVPTWNQRSTRSKFVFISFISVTLGFLWALVDENSLCWHDRISQTFPTSD